MRAFERIKKYISDAGLKQCAVAKRAGYTPRQFSRMMTGNKIIDIDDLQRICVALGVPADTFIQPNDEQHKT